MLNSSNPQISDENGNNSWNGTDRRFVTLHTVSFPRNIMEECPAQGGSVACEESGSGFSSCGTGGEGEELPVAESVEERCGQHHENTEMHGSVPNGNESCCNDGNGHESSGAESHGSMSNTRSTCTSLRCGLDKEGTKSRKSLLGLSPSGSNSIESEQELHNAGGSSDLLDRNLAHREMMLTLQEMKKRLPSEKRGNWRSSTIDTLNYALKCVKQVQANSEYYQLLMRDSGMPLVDPSLYTVKELETMSSEHKLKNTDTFMVVFSLLTGKIVFLSEQASSILGCRRKLLDSKFVELLAPQDVGVFYKHTIQAKLPLWNMGTNTTTSLFEYIHVKSFFCRISKDPDDEVRYCPFRITPYHLKVRSAETTEGQPCCLALAEKIHSGYEAPRIPLEKRIFTTIHTPGCVFLEVDDRAVPLLGYLPQDLIGTSVLAYLHPEDRPLMPAMHHKILKHAGQPPFEYSPIRFCTQNGDYITLDTSWSSFVNPWSRKVAFIIGRHKVRTGPLNEDVFATCSKEDLASVNEEIKTLQGQIYKVLLQPVYNKGSSGYGSLGSNGSHEHYISIASSSDSNGNCMEELQREPMTLQQICADVNRIKNLGQQVYIASKSKMRGKRLDSAAGQNVDSYYPQTLGKAEVKGQATFHNALGKERYIPSYQQINCVDSIIRYLESCNMLDLKRKCKTSSNTTSSSSEEENVNQTAQEGMQTAEVRAPTCPVPVGSGVVTDVQTTAAIVGAPLRDLTLCTKAMSVVSVTSQCSYSSTIVHVPQPESEATALEEAIVSSEPVGPCVTPSEEFWKVGLTKEVLCAHTEKEEQEYVNKFRQHILRSPCSSYLQQQSKRDSHDQGFHSSRQTGPAGWRKTKPGKPKHKRQKPLESSDSTSSRLNFPPRQRKAAPTRPCCPPSEGSHTSPSSMGFPAPLMLPFQTAYSMPGFPVPVAGASMLGDQAAVSSGPEPTPQPTMMYGIQPAPPYPAPYMAPMMVFLPPMYPQMNLQVAQPSFVPGQLPCVSSPYPFGITPVTGVPLLPPVLQEPPEPPSRSSTPASASGQQAVESERPPLFANSRSSSPLQLILLQEELLKAAEQQEGAERESLEELNCDAAAVESGNQDNQSTSSELLDLLLHEDSQSGTGSATSGSRSAESSGSNGSRSNRISGSGTESSNSLEYFASNDSSDTSQKEKKSSEAKGEDKVFKKCMGSSIWTMIESTPEAVMMTYQIPARDQKTVLKEDLEKLLAMQTMQPCFTENQKKELAEVHPWILKHVVPKERDMQSCIACDKLVVGSVASPSHLESSEAEGTSASYPWEEHTQQSAGGTSPRKHSAT
ncbi:period circadian protein homolog 3 isoform X1 [Latimeria chalumnae]|uniref:period circadian protein homolog 3 isoform X1 n=1 Tax=Latimeria chalumnae TaxID=7897 RepID=UPI0003C1711E|nr:PREDICTED: period circadian protein homolog 3 [Latimeria chalumnae]|eukprot:XP_014342834.1 PREDICTED: period circadian protein homolog 3 [Latimeria chalumnae]